MSSQSPLEVYESAITNEKRPCRQLASFEAQPPLSASLESCGYGIVSRRLHSNAENALRSMLLSCGILINNPKFVEVRSEGVSEDDDAACVNWFDPDHGLIICSENYKSRDRHTGAKMVWPSDVLWQTWKSTALEAGKWASDLRAIVLPAIINEELKIAIWQASKNSSSSRVEDHNQIEYTCLDNGFYAILGTPNGASTMRMLRDHKKELGHRIVEKIVVFGKENLKMETPETRSVAIILSDRRTPPSRISVPVLR
ncbi:hypothetical protein AA0118_g3464 [Alternaria tenuissima]|nr:hypothetical protein AALT_g1518 [Alternaria alternata]RYN65321.1 hypothetical protein AA0118_g3464 [Alternaria tenuissima]RYN87673.1 hypothetical protein AA0120_g7669 [Alternaria tenuissima]